MANDQQRAEDKIKEAERLVEDAVARAAGFVARALARTREEVEDIWAEAQTVSRSRS